MSVVALLIAASVVAAVSQVFVFLSKGSEDKKAVIS
jgi:archaellum component FlaG (FlaF/FlaG flagellin family)